MKGVLALQRFAFLFEGVLLIFSGVAAIWLALHDQRIGSTPAYVFVGVGCFLLSLPLVLITLIVSLERRERRSPRSAAATAAAGPVCPRCGAPWPQAWVAGTQEGDDTWFLRQQGLLQEGPQRCPSCGANDVAPVPAASPAAARAGDPGVAASSRWAWVLLGAAAALAAALSLLGLVTPHH